MSVLVEQVDRLSRETAAQVTGLWDRVREGAVDEDTFVRRSAATVNRANARATVTADKVTAADLRRQTGQPVRPAGIKPIDDRGRLETAIRKVARDKPKDATTDEEAYRSRRARLGRLARNEPTTAAQNTVHDALEHHESFLQGWVRAMGGSNTCPLCVRWADGVVRSAKVRMVRHHNCRCMARPVAKKAAQAKKTTGKFFGHEATKGVLGVLLITPADELAAGYVATKVSRFILSSAFAPQLSRAAHPTGGIFAKMAALERVLGSAGIQLAKGDYLIHGSGLLDALDMRAAGDLDLVVHPDVFDQIAQSPGWYTRMAGVEKDHPVLQHPDLDRIGVEISKPHPGNLIGGDQVAIADLAQNTVTIRGKEFITPEQLTLMKTRTMSGGVKVAKNKRDLALLDGRLTWAEDVLRFGRQVNTSGGQASILERRALQQYGKGSFELNPKLRAGEALTKTEERQVGLIDQAIARQATPHRVKVYRGLRMSREEALQMYGDKIDTVVTEHSYLSTGLREQVARKYGQSGVYLEIDVPAGTNGYFAPYRALAPEPTPNAITRLFGEDELLLPRGTRYRIKELVERDDGTILVRAEVVPSRLGAPPAPGAGRLFVQAEAADPAEAAARLEELVRIGRIEPGPRVSVVRPVRAGPGNRSTRPVSGR